MEEFKEKITKLNETTEFQEFMSAEQDERMKRNTDLYIAKREGRTEIIKKMAAKGMPLEQIQEITEIPVEEIKTLLQS